MAIQTSRVRNALMVLRRCWAWAYFGEDPSTIAQNVVSLNGEYLLTLTNASNPANYTPQAVPTGCIGMIGVDNTNTIQIPAVGSGVPVNISNLTLQNPGIVEINNQFINPTMLKTVSYNETLNASIGTTPFFIADQAYTVTAISYIHKTQGTGTAVCSVVKDTGTTVPGAGVALQTGTFACTTVVINTTTAATLTATTANLTLAAGDRLSVLFTGTTTTLAGVVITVTMTPTVAGEYANVFWRANGDIATQTFFEANRDMVITGIRAIYGTAFAAAVTIDCTKDSSTTAAGGGTSILAAPMAGDGTINTVLAPALTATASVLTMAAGSRLALKFSATTTGALLCVVVTFQPLYIRKEVTWQLAPNAQQQVAQCFFIADRNYEVVDASCIFDVAAGGAAKLGVTIDKGTTAPGAGNVVQTDNTSAGFDMNAAARTTQFMTPATRHLRLMSPGDRLGLVVTGAAQSIADACITVSLLPNY